MTRDEAINYLRSSGYSEEQINAVVEGLTCDDCISRENLLHEIAELMKSPWFNNGKDDDTIAHYGYIERKEAVEIVRDLCVKEEPSVQPCEMREPAEQERKSVDNYVKSISKPTGNNFYQPCEDAVSRADLLRLYKDLDPKSFVLVEYVMRDVKALPPVTPAREKGEFTRQELENWLYSICLNNDGTGFCKEIIDEIISRLDGFEKYVEDMRGGE